METKIISAEQVSQLEIGMIIKRIPSNGIHEDIFDEKKTKLIDTYVIRSIHPLNKMIGLVMTDVSLIFNASPGDVGRLFIHSDKLVEQNIWWLKKMH